MRTLDAYIEGYSYGTKYFQERVCVPSGWRTPNGSRTGRPVRKLFVRFANGITVREPANFREPR